MMWLKRFGYVSRVLEQVLWNGVNDDSGANGRIKKLIYFIEWPIFGDCMFDGWSVRRSIYSCPSSETH